MVKNTQHALESMTEEALTLGSENCPNQGKEKKWHAQERTPFVLYGIPSKFFFLPPTRRTEGDQVLETGYNQAHQIKGISANLFYRV